MLKVRNTSLSFIEVVKLQHQNEVGILAKHNIRSCYCIEKKEKWKISTNKEVIHIFYSFNTVCFKQGVNCMAQVTN